MSSLSLAGAQGIGSLFLVAASWVGLADAVDVDICATFNTASMNRNVSMFQTNGLCHDFCTPQGYAYAITQSNNCWCSNYTPAKSAQVSTSKCSLNCPGYPDEKCGGQGLFAYLNLNAALPSGTKGPDASSTTEDNPSTSTSSSLPMTTSSSSSSSSTSSTVGLDLQTPSPIQTTSSAPITSTTQSLILTQSQPTETTSKPASTIATVTADGTVRTVTIVPTETGAGGHASGDNQSVSVQDSGLKTGAIVGIVVGIVGGVLVLAGLIMFFYFRRKKQRQENDYRDDPSIRGSSSGMMGSGRPEMSRAPGSPGSTGNRSSTLQIDPRMDPFQQSLYARSGSRESVNTLRDDHDYSRRIQQPKVLRATNPDPEHSSGS